jgi:hypothetical protein
MLRRQLYIEGVKRYEAQLFAPVLLGLERIVRNEILMLPVETMADLTKKQLDNVTSAVRVAYQKALKEYIEQHKGDLEQLVKSDLALTGRVVGAVGSDFPMQREPRQSVRDFIDILTGTAEFVLVPTNSFVDGVIHSLRGDPIAALGSYMEYFLGDHITRISHGVLNLIRKAVVEALTPYQTVLSIVGSAGMNYRDGFLNRVWNWNKTAVNTTVQHATAVVSKELFGAMFDHYIWLSVLESNTCKLCWDRHGTIYKYGYGPIPPAHPNCQCSTSPLLGGEVPDSMPGFVDWMAEQADELIKDTSGTVSPNEIAKKAGFILGIALSTRYLKPYINP